MPTPKNPTNHSELIARALILHQSHVLMCRNISANYLYLPGGHIEFAEPASEALKRELLEETAQKLAVGPLLLTTENTFNDGHQDHHEINLIFQAQLFHMEQFPPAHPKTALPNIQSQESHIDFVWIDLAAVADLDIRPIQIKAWLATGGQAAATFPPAVPPTTTTTTAGAAGAAPSAGGAGEVPSPCPIPEIPHAPHLTNFEIPTPAPTA